MSSNKVNKSRGCRYYGRGHKKHKSGAKGGVGGAGKWSHNKNARKFRVIQKRDYSHYIRASRLALEIEFLKSAGVTEGLTHTFKVSGKENSLVNFNLVQERGEFHLDGKFKKVLREPLESLVHLPDSYVVLLG